MYGSRAAARLNRKLEELDSFMNYLDLGPFSRVTGTVRLPGSKSISNRVLLLAALAEGETTITHLLDSDDTRVMLEALMQLGVKLRHNDQRAWSRAPAAHSRPKTRTSFSAMRERRCAH